MTPNQIRDKARAVCDADPAKKQAAIDAWARVYQVVPHYEGTHANYRRQRKITEARLAILQSIADGGSADDAERAGRAVLA
ncbi:MULTISPECIES: hypothetical protein [unclassified Mesorhizobium]|uniref:hypothetical protein n=1 Tax=unclassified Mesorhizobium TaxID=325217 RepID=UPI001125BDDA|nr:MULTISPECIES: hypothetical protein [unclassified Mesorhizobium]TPK59055.1 hypothetical protein FJ551_25935 [Mesorhizobium sp. B2-5-1]TPL06664.1 hypothetical protein FJ944_22810 [Mesorhizobium sp. B2-4-11]